MASIEKKLIISYYGKEVTPEEFTDDVIKNNPSAFSEEDKAVLNRFWSCVICNI